MRSCWLLMAALCAGCSGTDAPDAGGPRDARAPDAAPDAAAAMDVPCGDLVCDGATEFCLEEAQGACVAPDAGACGADQEPCNLPQGTGCVPIPNRSCQALPDGCRNCVCLIDQMPCGPGLQSATCSSQAGLTVRCPP